MMKQDSNLTTSSNHHTLATVCGQCGVEERKLLHNVRNRGTFRRLCTSCVLLLHPQCFCPSCLGLYDRLPPDDAVVCYKCYSSSHPNCVSSPPPGTIESSRGPYICSSCLNPNLLVFNLNRIDNGSRYGGRVIDNNAARLLLAAAKIASMSMNKAEVAAAMEAERRAREASYTKKRAREALDHVVMLMGKEKRNVVDSKRKICHVNNMPVVAADATVKNKVDASSEVSEALNAVELKDNGVVLVKSSIPESRSNGVVEMEIDTVSGKDSGVDSNAENGCARSDGLVKIAQNDQEQPSEKIQPLQPED